MMAAQEQSLFGEVWKAPKGAAAGLDGAVMGPILVTGFGFSTGIRNQLAVFYRLGSA